MVKSHLESLMTPTALKLNHHYGRRFMNQPHLLQLLRLVTMQSGAMKTRLYFNPPASTRSDQAEAGAAQAVTIMCHIDNHHPIGHSHRLLVPRGLARRFLRPLQG